MADAKVKGITSKKKDPVPPAIVPDDEENKHLSKTQFIEKQRKIKERELKLKEFGAELDKVETKVEVKKPKKIE